MKFGTILQNFATFLQRKKVTREVYYFAETQKKIEFRL